MKQQVVKTMYATAMKNLAAELVQLRQDASSEQTKEIDLDKCDRA